MSQKSNSDSSDFESDFESDSDNEVVKSKVGAVKKKFEHVDEEADPQQEQIDEANRKEAKRRKKELVDSKLTAIAKNLKPKEEEEKQSKGGKSKKRFRKNKSKKTKKRKSKRRKYN